jgi:hypothetical protein
MNDIFAEYSNQGGQLLSLKALNTSLRVLLPLEFLWKNLLLF